MNTQNQGRAFGIAAHLPDTPMTNVLWPEHDARHC